MTVTLFRRMLAEHLELESVGQAQDNGRSSSHDFGAYRYNAGIAQGLQIAAMVTQEFLKDDEGDIDG